MENQDWLPEQNPCNKCESQPDAHRQTATCPTCRGKKTVFAFSNLGEDHTKHTQGDVACPSCKGLGAVPDIFFELQTVGRELRAARVARGQTLMDAAQADGTEASQLSALECGRFSENDLKMAYAMRRVANHFGRTFWEAWNEDTIADQIIRKLNELDATR